MQRSSSSRERRRAVVARRAEPRLRLIMLLTVSTCQRCPYNASSAPRANRRFMLRRWRVDGAVADAVVLATPARATAQLLTSSAPELARLLAMMDHAGVVIVTIAVADWPDRLRGRSGYLVPKPVQRTVTAASFGSQKWAH